MLHRNIFELINGACTKEDNSFELPEADMSFSKGAFLVQQVVDYIPPITGTECRLSLREGIVGPSGTALIRMHKLHLQTVNTFSLL